MPKIIVYSTSSCPYCMAAKEYIKAHNFELEDVNVEVDANRAQEMIEKSGQMGVPVIQIDDKIIIGFDKVAIDQALNIKE